MEISLNLLQEVDAEALFKFESENRWFFEEMVPSRGDDYYTFETFLRRHQELLKEQKNGLSYFYLITNDAGEILGRINLVDKKDNIADIGFRVGATHVGKGIGNQALNLLLKTDLSVKQIRGKTTTVNHASQKVLERNGFKQVRVGDEEFEMNGEIMRFTHYLWENENPRL
ncbi:GNAT family protein [Planococcus sp. S3-L1]|uniref:GNAT family N-acetyltransferase n=1 Tax=Planococcus sp. S3-L1 TaxID=3046200 RepID=UPI0024BA3190|nr:GNAT family protein [Planococcus sp. S3-L1]MDJ0332866.1 GNAT family protein [Planococcus sp. S3-L1]